MTKPGGHYATKAYTSLLMIIGLIACIVLFENERAEANKFKHRDLGSAIKQLKKFQAPHIHPKA